MVPRLSTLLLSAFAASLAQAAVDFQRSGPAFYGEPPDATHPWSIHDRNRPQPARVDPGTPSTATQPGKPPSDAIVLFDGTEKSLVNWEADTKPGEPTAPSKWIVQDGALECVPKSGYLRSKAQFGDCQLHIEWAAPAKVLGDSQGRGNSGIFLLARPGVAGASGIEVQVLDSYDNPSYPDGSAGAIYGINPPMVNVIRPPGQFQTVDIIFRRPIFRDGKQVDSGRVTVLINGVLVQDSTPLEGPGGHLKRSSPVEFPEQGVLKLQDHGNPVRFRNIWYRPLPPRPVSGGTDGGILTAEATTAKRKEIAASIRRDAASMKGDQNAYMLRLAESLIYEQDAAAGKEVEKLATSYVSGLKSLSGAALDNKKEEALSVAKAFAYLTKNKMVSASFAPKNDLDGIIKAQGWDDANQKKKKK
ncbi:MAG: DUF1080 domain-containing protein [Verrucomicrobiota bacterium]